jgi:tyrosine-protein phosphatase YwqE
MDVKIDMLGDRFEAIKEHIAKHKVVYSSLATGVVFAGITALIMRGVAKQPISSSVTGTAGSSVTGTGKKVVISNVSFISSDRQGPPSWVVRCKETGNIFTSQRAASLAMEISETNISKQLNGLQTSAQGYTFERICMAA